MGIFKFFDTLAKFNTLKVSTMSDDSAYRIGSGLEIVGTPDILWKDICFIEDKGLIWNHGMFYADLNELKIDVAGIKEDVQCIKVRNYFYTSYDETSTSYKIKISGTQTTDKDMRYEIVSLSSKDLATSDDYVYIDNDGVNASFGNILSFNNQNQYLKLYQTGGDASKAAELYYGYDRINFITETVDRYCKVIDISGFINTLPSKIPDSNSNTFGYTGGSGNGRLSINITSILSVYPEIYLDTNSTWSIKLCDLSTKNSVLSCTKISGTNIAIDGMGLLDGESFSSYTNAVNYLKNQHFYIVFKLRDYVSTSLSSLGITINKKYFNRAKNTSEYIWFSNNSVITSGCAELAYLSSKDYLYTKDQIDNKFYTQTYLTNRFNEITSTLNAENIFDRGTGDNSVLVKDNESLTSGAYSISLGYQTSSDGPYSVTEGYGTVTGGSYETNTIVVDNTVGMNGNNPLPGAFSHAEGRATIASGGFSHAEGNKSFASGVASHAEGNQAKATGAMTHAEGYNTQASGQSAHSEGFQTTSNGNFTHSEGNRTIAYGVSSHTEGYLTYTYGGISHAEGYLSYTYGNYSHAEGVETISYGMVSHAEGRLTYSYGQQSHAEGSQSVSYGHFSHAEGQGTIAFGNISHAEIGSWVNMFKLSGDANSTHYTGTITDSEISTFYKDGHISLAVLSNIYKSSWICTIANPLVLVKISDCILSDSGNNTITITLDLEKTLSAETALNESDVQIHMAIAYGTYSHMESGSVAYGNRTHTEGRDTIAIGTGSHAEGHHVLTGGEGSHGEGFYAITYGTGSHVEGEYTYAVGDGSHAEGYGSYAYNFAEHAEGKWNKSNTGTISSIGIGTSESDRKNAVEVMNDGSVYIKGLGGFDGTNPSSSSTIQSIFTELLTPVTNTELENIYGIENE